MSNENEITRELRNRVTTFTDQKITNVINQANLYPKDLVHAAKVIAQERGMNLEEMRLKIENAKLARKEIRAFVRKGKKGGSIKLKDLAEKYNIDQKEADRILAQEIDRVNREQESESSGKGGLWTAIVIIIIIIRIVLRMSNN